MRLLVEVAKAVSDPVSEVLSLLRTRGLAARVAPVFDTHTPGLAPFVSVRLEDANQVEIALAALRESASVRSAEMEPDAGIGPPVRPDADH